MLMAAARLDLASVFLYAGSIAPGWVKLSDGTEKEITIIDSFEAVGAVQAGKMSVEDAKRIECAFAPGEGTCGGMALCASCQCYIESSHPLPERSEDEEAMLAEAFNVRDNSRLGCQIQMIPELNGLEITLAPEE